MFHNDGSVNYELDQWELDDCASVFDLDSEYFSIEQEVE